MVGRYMSKPNPMLMKEKELLEQLKKDIGLDLPNVIFKSNGHPYKVDVEGTPMGTLQLRQATLYYNPSDRFKSHADIVYNFLNHDELRKTVRNICKLISGIRGIRIEGNRKTISMKESVYHSFVSSEYRELISDELYRDFSGAVVVKVLDDKTDEVLREMQLE